MCHVRRRELRSVADRVRRVLGVTQDRQGRGGSAEPGPTSTRSPYAERSRRSISQKATYAPACGSSTPSDRAERAALAHLFERAGRFEEAAAYYANIQVRTDDERRLRARASAEQLASHGHPRSAIAILERWTATRPGRPLCAGSPRRASSGGQPSRERREEGPPTLEVIDDPLLLAHLVDVLERRRPQP